MILVDTRRLPDSFAAVEFFESRRIPYVVAVNDFDGADRYPLDEVREALTIGPRVPVVRCDARIGSWAKGCPRCPRRVPDFPQKQR